MREPLRHAGPSARLLIVDDDRDTAEALGAIFAQASYGVDTAENAEAALEKIREAPSPYQVVLADVELPGESGLELVRRIREEHPTTAVVVITGHASVQTAVTALKHGAVDYL